MKSLLKIIICFIFMTLLTTNALADSEKCNRECPLECTVVSLSVEEEREVTPNVFLFPVRIVVTKGTEAEVINTLGKIDEKLGNLNLQYSTKQGYIVNKNCWWEVNKQKCSGYRGDMSYTFELESTSLQVEVLKVIESFKNNGVDYSVESPRWIVSNKQRKQAEKDLRSKIILTLKDQTREFSTLIGKKCDLSKVTFEGQFSTPVILKGISAEFKSANAMSAPEPPQKEEKVTVRAVVEIVCK